MLSKQISIKDFFNRNLAWFMIIPALVVVIVIIVLPMIYSFYLSLTNFDLLRPDRIRFVSLANYGKLFQDSIFWRAFWNTVIFMTVAVNVEFILGLFLAQLIFRVNRGQSIIRTAIMAPMMFAPVLVGFQFKWFFNDQVGLVNNLLYLFTGEFHICLLYTSPSPRDRTRPRLPSSA